MAKIKLSVKAVERLRGPDPSGKQALYWDTELPGFGVLVSGVKRNASFIVQRDLPGGKTRRVTIAPTNAMSLPAARARAEAIIVDLFAGKDPKAARDATTLGSTLEAYIKARPGLRASTVREYRDMVEGHLESWLQLPLAEISSEMVERRHRSIAAEIERDDGRPGQARANAVMRALRALYNYQMEHDPKLGRNPVRLTRAWFKVGQRDRHISEEQLPVFYRAVCELPNAVAKDYLLLLLFTGLRRTEAAGLRWSDVDLPKRVIHIAAAQTKAGRKLDLPMTDVVHDLLVARRALGDAKYVFPSNSRSGFIQEPKFPLTLVAKATGIDVSAHDLRRTFITVAESTDMSPLALKALVNHALPSGDVTAGYVQMNVERLRAPAQRVADRLKELCGIVDVSGKNVKKLSSLEN
jgi:integrase